MQRTNAGAGLAVLGTAWLFAFGCSSNPGPTTPPAIAPERTYHFRLESTGGYGVPDAQVEARTDDSTYRVTGNSTGDATIRIPNERPLPAELVFTFNAFSAMPAAASAATEPGSKRNVLVRCDDRPGTILVRAPSLLRLGDGLADGGTANEFQVRPGGDHVDFGFSLLAVPRRMPTYRLSIRGIEALVELRLNGHLVGRLRPSANNALAVQSDTLQGSPANVFLLTQNVLTIKTVGLGSNPANLDDIELAAVLLYYP
jgi:hypothetical protein